MRVVVPLFASCRPLHWLKNALVMAPVFFGREWSRAAEAAAAALAMTLAASAGYLLNDLVDRIADRAHPRRANRPLARGDLAPGVAWIAAAISAAGGLAIATALGWEPAAWTAGYLGLAVAHSAGAKRIPAIGVLVPAAGYPLRVALGGAATGIPVTEWLLGCTGMLALFLLVGKRQWDAERNLGGSAIWALAGAALALYAAYTQAPETVERFGTRALAWTAIPAAAGMGRGAWILATRRGFPRDPLRALATDPIVAASLAAWIGAFAWIVAP